MNTFKHDIVYYSGMGFGYRVFEVINGENVLRIISGAHWQDPWLCGMFGMLDSLRLKQVSKDHERELVAA